MPITKASPAPSDAAKAARILRAKSPLRPADFAKLDREAKKRAFTVTEEVSLDVIRNMRDELAKAKADGVPYREFVDLAGERLGAQWGIDSPQLKTIFVNNVQQATNQAIVARLNSQRGTYPYWTMDVVHDEVTSATCSYFLEHPIVLPAGHSWWAKNAPMRHHRCRSTLRGLTATQAQKLGITKDPPDWPADAGWGGSAPMGEYKANMSDRVRTMVGRYDHIDFVPPKGARDEAKRGLEWRSKHGRGGTAVGVARARDIANGAQLSPSTVRRMKAFFDRHQNGAGEGSKPGEDGFPSPWRIAWALWGGDPGYAWARKVVGQLNAADEKAKTMKDKTVKQDLGSADVHADGPMKVRRAFAKPGLAKGKPKAKLTKTTKVAARRGLSFRFSRGGTSIEVRHMRDSMPVVMRGEDTLFPGIELGAELLAECKSTVVADDQEVELSKWSPPRWNQLAKVGTFRGHPAGPFELTPVIFDEIVANFNATVNKRIPLDYEHASEAPATEGSIPTEGAPAHGWIIALENRGRAGLWGLTTLHPKAAQKVREGQYMFFSPAIRFGSKDRVTGQPIGARMTSGALTNNPFLDGMAPFLASDRGGKAHVVNMETIAMKLGEYEFDAADVMPKLRMGLFGTGTHQADMATAAECYDALCRIEAAYTECVAESRGAEPVRVQAALKQLREGMGFGMGLTVPEMLALVKQIVEHMIGEHEEEMHPDEEVPPSSREMGNKTMADQDTTIKLRDAETKLVALTNENTSLETKVASLDLQLADRNSRIQSLENEVKTLRDDAQKRAEADETAAIELAFATYKDTHKLTDAHKKSMRITYQHDRATFNELYPVVAPDQRHLQRTMSTRHNPATQPNVNHVQQYSVLMSANGQGAQTKPFAQAHYELTNRLMSDKKMPLELATVEARRQLTESAPVTT